MCHIVLSVEFLVFKDSQDSIRHYTMIPKRAENFAKNITTRIRFGEENHLDEFAKIMINRKFGRNSTFDNCQLFK